MKRVLLTLFATIGIALLAHASPASAAVSDWQKGISVQSRYGSDFSSPSFRQSIDNAFDNGVNFVTLVIPVHQDKISSSNVYSGNDTPTDNALSAGLNYIRSKGMQSAIAVHDDPYDYQWRAFIRANDTTAWFASYGTQLIHYASIAQSSGASQMVIGTEMSSMTVPANTAQWVQMIANIRTYFNGSLTYGAQRTGYMSDAQTLGFWPQLDKIGLSAYYGLGSDGSVAALKNEWSQYDQQEISVLSARYHKPIIFTEVGYVSRDGSTGDPGTGYQLSGPINTGLQANAYQALFQYWGSNPSIGGVFFWDWSSDPNAGGENDGGYTPQNKPAQGVMKQWFTQPAGSSTPVAAPASKNYTVTTTPLIQPTIGIPILLPVSVSASTVANDMIVDIETYNAQNQRVNQQFFEHQQLSPIPQVFTSSWTPLSSGTYTVKAGIFTGNWQSSVLWNNTLQSYTVSTATQPPVVPIQPPQPIIHPVTPPAIPPVTPPVVTPPKPVTSPTTNLPTTISIWWPGGTVRGVQPYKAVIDGRDSSTYDMYWQVDGGMLNKMGDDTTPIAHKESLVDMTNWHWNASGSYIITFLAKDLSGQTISQKSVTLQVIQ